MNMIYMLCRNEVKDYERWRKIFDADAPDHREAGLKLLSVWCDRENKNNVFFSFEVQDLAKTKEFIAKPEAKQQAEKAGVINGEFYFLDRLRNYD